jgi:hypothetical protein
MQIAGEHCSQCGQNICLEINGTWCAKCGSKFHRDCLNKLQGHCTTCKQEYSPPELLFKYSLHCPECMHSTGGIRKDCPQCFTRTCWDTQEDYNMFRKQHANACVIMILKGIAEILLGIISIGLFFGLFFFSFYGNIILTWGLLLGAGMVLIGDGVFRLRRGNKLRHFI